MRSSAKIRELIASGIPTAFDAIPRGLATLLVFTKEASGDFIVAQTEDGRLYQMEKGDSSSQHFPVLRRLGEDLNSYKLPSLLNRVSADDFTQCLVYRLDTKDHQLIRSEFRRSASRLAQAKELHATQTPPLSPTVPMSFD